ncbi:nucleotidyltransferase domain-containing protein [Hymenobacter busanensis]|uniref:Nucleotidyltransferase domain-containing protein n=1 Tax=Hymenobacter busanensis TaxID=2607656 RepID=A0A7L4ZSY2_9BACT|nr:nucleotidyltransferase domain-containing protein [Hymenobacter busanensis]KAA9327445.1 nucleotidyltransferase domain-containing protein [Hymenobacter busanensis]QHJ06218.1 nucleotidyltransferase [Hymenobacter busanensis]
MHARIHAALTRLEASHGIRILYACEAGSRAWGFPSPDSDYDVRFVYCHPPQWYLALDESRDTLVFPIDDELDLSGWELRKTLRLLRGSNAALLEWLQSPIVYHEAADFRAVVQPQLPECFNPLAVLHHYQGLVRRGVEEDLLPEEVRLKRLFYALRSALAARWIRERQTLPPMAFAPLRVLLPAALQPHVDALLQCKASANEKTTVPRPELLVAFIEAEYAANQHARTTLPTPRRHDPTPALSALFRRLLGVA